MSMYTKVNPDLAGAAPNLVAVSASDTFQNDGRDLLHVKNASGSSIVVTVKDQGTTPPVAAESFIPDIQVTVPAAQERYIGPFPPNRFNDPNGLTTVQYSAITTVTAEVIDVAVS